VRHVTAAHLDAAKTARGVWADEAGDPAHPLVVVIHGTMDRSSGMLKLSRQLDSRARVLRYDRRGYGRSAPHPGPFTMDEQVDDLVALLDGRSAVLVGHSYGGNVALATAARHPSLVRAVSMYESPLSWEPWWPGSTAGATALATGGSPAEAAERFMRRMIGDGRWDALPERTRAVRRMEGDAMVGELVDLRSAVPWRAEDIHVPVICGYGTEGALHHRKGMEHVASTVAGSELVELTGCRHDAPLSHPVLFARLMVEPLL
jgi:pimeloyl-ACP methyl ester carboxylesterase